MSDELKHECAVAMVVLRGTTVAAGDYGGTKLSLLMEKQHNRGQDGAGAAILSNNPNPGEPPYWIAKSASATPLADILAAASSNANTNVSMMGETFKYCAPIAGALGFSAEDTAEAIGLMGNAGIKSSQAGTFSSALCLV